MSKPSRRRGRRFVFGMEGGRLVRKESEKEQIERIATDLFFKVVLKDFLGIPPRIQITGQYSFTVPRTAYEVTPPRKLAIAGILSRLYHVDADTWGKIQHESPNKSERELFEHFAFVIKQSQMRIPVWIGKNIPDLFVEPILYMESFRKSGLYTVLSTILDKKANESEIMVLQSDMVLHDRAQVKASISKMWRYRNLEGMFKPDRFSLNILGINVYRLRNQYNKTISAYDFFRTLFYHDLVQLESPFRDVPVLGLAGERELPIGSVIRTKKGNAFSVTRKLGGGANANVYEAETLENDSGIPSTVALKVGAKKLLHEVAVYKSVEAQRLEQDKEDPAIPRYYDYVYIAGIVVIVLENIDGSSRTLYQDLSWDQKKKINEAEEFANRASGITLQDVEGPGNVMIGSRTDTRYPEHGVYLIDLDPFGQAG
jgi:hypothetical protein